MILDSIYFVQFDLISHPSDSNVYGEPQMCEQIERTNSESGELTDSVSSFLEVVRPYSFKI